jgi:hypothetical protein
MSNVESRARYVQILMEKVREDRYPSATHMALIEQALPAQWIPAYLEILFEKVAEDANPSIPMLMRIGRLLDAAG